MTSNDLAGLLNNESTARRVLRNPETAAFLKGQFGIGRTPYIHTVTVGDTELRLKFYNVVKQILNSKGKEVPGKESFLSYIEVTVAPSGRKATMFTMDVTQAVWAPSKTKAIVKHDEAIAALKTFAESFGIDLNAPAAWCTTYSMNY